MSSYQQVNVKSEFTNSKSSLMDIPMVPSTREAVTNIHMAPVKHEEAAMDIHMVPVKREAVVIKNVVYGPLSLTRKQKLALKWHFGTHRYITIQSQLEFLFEQFPISYSKRDKQLLLKAMGKHGKLRGYKRDVLAGKKSNPSPDRVSGHTAGKRQAKQPSPRSATGANAIPQGIRKAGTRVEKKRQVRAHNAAVGANKNQTKSISSDGSVPSAPRNSPDPAFDAMLETMGAMCLD